MTELPIRISSGTTLESLFSAASSTVPIPGGGTITAISGYLGVSLLLKSIRVSGRRQADAIDSPLEKRLLMLASRLLLAAQADSEAFAQYIQATKLPKATRSEQSARHQAMSVASVAATEAALDILDLGNEVLDCAHQLQDRIIAPVRADARAGVELISAMNITARENALSNLIGIEPADSIKERLAGSTARYQVLIAACRNVHSEPSALT